MSTTLQMNTIGLKIVALVLIIHTETTIFGEKVVEKMARNHQTIGHQDLEALLGNMIVQQKSGIYIYLQRSNQTLIGITLRLDRK